MECYSTHLGLWRAVIYSRKLWLPFPLSFYLTWLTKHAYLPCMLAGTRQSRGLAIWARQQGHALLAKEGEKRGGQGSYNFLQYIMAQITVPHEWRIIFCRQQYEVFVWGKSPYQKLWDHLGKRDKLDLRSTKENVYLNQVGHVILFLKVKNGFLWKVLV